MSNLTKEQLDHLTQSIDDRLDEFPGHFDHIAPGVVRIAFDVIEEWLGLDLPDAGAWPQAADVIAGELTLPAAPKGLPSNGNGAHHEQEDTVTSKPIDEPVIEEPVHRRSSKPRLRKVGDGAYEDAGEDDYPDDEPVSETSKRAPYHRYKPKMHSDNPKRNYLPTLEELIAEVRRQAMGGVMPSISQFDQARPTTWATAGAHIHRLNLSGWAGLAGLAGLQPKRSGPERTTEPLPLQGGSGGAVG